MTAPECYIIRFTKAAQRDFDGLASHLQTRIVRQLRILEVNPYTSKCLKLSGRDNVYRLRVGDYRILYRVDTVIRIVRITRIAHRREVYR
ncbi:MAG: type II toxin-antitoxin system RelE/ParE family toxin [Calditrichota bacterium]